MLSEKIQSRWHLQPITNAPHIENIKRLAIQIMGTHHCILCMIIEVSKVTQIIVILS